MRLLKTFDRGGYHPAWPRKNRDAVRVLVCRDDQAFLIYSPQTGFYKAPGGGIEEGETKEQALCREAREEAGLVLVPHSICEFGKIVQIGRDIFGEKLVFSHTSYYYTAQAQEHYVSQELDDYEAALGYHPVWIPLSKAIEENLKRVALETTDMLLRETWVMEKYLEEKGLQQKGK